MEKKRTHFLFHLGRHCLTNSFFIALGLNNPLNFGFWGYIYSLMVYLPAYCIPRKENSKKSRSWLYFLVIILPFILDVPLYFAAISIRMIFTI